MRAKPNLAIAELISQKRVQRVFVLYFCDVALFPARIFVDWRTRKRYLSRQQQWPSGRTAADRHKKTREGPPKFLPIGKGWRSMKRFDAYDVTLRYLTAERWRSRDEHVVIGDARPADGHLTGFHDEADARDFRYAMRERVQAFSPALRLEQSAELLRGVLKELAEMHGLDGHEVAHGPVGPHVADRADASGIGRLQIEKPVGRARAERSTGAGRIVAKAAGTLFTLVGRAMPSRRTLENGGFYITRHHISEA